jgi:hypothetical protein
VVLNGEPDGQPHPTANGTSAEKPPPKEPRDSTTSQPAIPNVEYATLSRALAKDLLGATLDSSTQRRLRGTEAKSLATLILQRLGLRDDTADPTSRLAVASWLGLSGPLGLAGAGIGGIKRISVRRWRVAGDGFESPVDDDADEPDAAAAAGSQPLRETWDIAWSVCLGSVTSEWEVRGLSLDDARGGDDEATADGAAARRNGAGASTANGEADTDWKAKFLGLQKELDDQRAETKRIKDALLDAVL